MVPFVFVFVSPNGGHHVNIYFRNSSKMEHLRKPAGYFYPNVRTEEHYNGQQERASVKKLRALYIKKVCLVLVTKYARYRLFSLR